MLGRRGWLRRRETPSLSVSASACLYPPPRPPPPIVAPTPPTCANRQKKRAKNRQTIGEKSGREVGGEAEQAAVLLVPMGTVFSSVSFSFSFSFSPLRALALAQNGLAARRHRRPTAAAAAAGPAAAAAAAPGPQPAAAPVAAVPGCGHARSSKTGKKRLAQPSKRPVGHQLQSQPGQTEGKGRGRTAAAAAAAAAAVGGAAGPEQQQPQQQQPPRQHHPLPLEPERVGWGVWEQVESRARETERGGGVEGTHPRR